MNYALIVFLGMFVLMFVLNLPIGFGMLAAGASYFLIKGISLTAVANAVCSQYWTSYTIIAIPLFIFTSNVMNTGGVTRKLYAFTDAITGRLRGGMAYVNCIVSLIFAGMTGSAVADASGTGLMELKEMRRQGYPEPFSAALTGATATVGPVFPPSITMLMYASVTGASVGRLFMGGIMPAIIMIAGLMTYSAYMAYKHKFPYGTTYTFYGFIVATFKAIPALFTVAILLGGIYLGVFTPTEAGAVAGFYALLISFFVYKVLGWKDLKTILVDTIEMVGRVAIAVGCAAVIVYISGLERLPQVMGGWILGLTDNKYVFLLIVNIMFLVMGCLFDTNTITLVFLPLLLNSLAAMEIDLVYFGVVFTVNMMIGLLTPPFGSLLFVTSAISECSMGELIKALIPMILILIASLLLITYVPNLIMYLPGLMKG